MPHAHFTEEKTLHLCVSNTRLSLVNPKSKKTKIFPPVSWKVQRNKAKCLYENCISV